MSKRGAIRLTLVFTVALVLCACGGRASDNTAENLGVAASDAGIYFRAVAVFDAKGTRIVTFSDPSRPKTFPLAPSDGTEVPSPRWSPDGRRLAYGVGIGEGRFAWYIAKAPGWVGEGAPLVESTGTVVWWIGMRLVVVDADGWSLFSEDGQLLGSGPVASTYERAITAHGALIVPVPTGYVWLHHSREPRWIDLEGPADFIPVDDGNRLLVGVALPDRAAQISTEDIWAVDETYAPDCIPSVQHDCLLRPYEPKFVPDTNWVVLDVGTRGAGMLWSSLVAVPWGTPLTLSLAANAPGVLKTYGSAGWPTADIFVGQTMWRVPIEREERELPLERIDFAQGVEDAEIETLAVLDAGSAYWSTTVQDTVFLAQRVENNNPITGIWDKLDLDALVPRWEETSIRGEYGSLWGSTGFLTVQATSATPLNLTLKCNPCIYTVLRELFKPGGASVTGEVASDEPLSLFKIGGVVVPAPDESGVLVRHNGMLYYHVFAAPSVRFPLVEVTEDAVFTPARTWGDP